MKKINTIALAAAFDMTLRIIRVASVIEAGRDRRDFKSELIGDIHRMTLETLKSIPENGTKFHCADSSLPEGVSYADIELEKLAGREGICAIRHIRVGLSSFKLEPDTKPGELYRPGTSFRRVRVSRPVVDAELRDGLLVGVRFDGDQYSPSKRLDDCTIRELKRVKKLMLRAKRAKLLKGHPMATVK